MSKITVTAGGLLVVACCSAACATKFKAAPDAGSASGITGVGAGGAPSGSQPGTTAMAGNASVTVGNSGKAATPPTGTSGTAPAGNAGSTATAGTSAVGTSAAGGTTMSGNAGTETGSAGMAASGSGIGGTAAPIVCPTMVMPPGETNGTISVGGVMRDYILHVPTGYTGKMPVPLVTDWHPILFDDTTEQGVSGYQALADQEGFVVVWPNGIDHAWNIGDCCTTSRTVDDVGFARALVAKLEQQLCIDPKRVYATGYSMGGGMSYKLACDAADLVAAVAPASFEMMQPTEWPCQPSRPITVISTNGTLDNVVPYTGGDVSPPNGLNVVNHFLGAPGTFQEWAMLDGCTDQPADKGNGCQTYSQCQAGVEVTLCTVQGGGHLPGDAPTEWATLKRFTLP